MSEQSDGRSAGIGFVGLLTILFIALKLLGKIAWSWWWVLSPIWIMFILYIVVFIIFFVWLVKE